MKNYLFILLITCFATSLLAQDNVKSGLIIGGGTGSIKTDIKPVGSGNTTTNEINYKSNFSIGYRFRIQQPKITPLFFIDLDANVGMKAWKSAYGKSYMEPSAYEASTKYYFVSIGGTANYSIYKGLSIGAGIEPTYYFYQSGEKSTSSFDIPLIGKLAYNFGFLELGINYKYGLMNTLKTQYINSGKFSDWQVSVFIPF